MTKTTIKKISENHNLVAFCNKILSYNTIFENEITRNMFLVSLISADVLINEATCDDTITEATFILDHINLFVLEEDIKNSIIDYLKKAIKIAKRDKKEFKQQNKKGNVRLSDSRNS